jgi:hypothetical protein
VADVVGAPSSGAWTSWVLPLPPPPPLAPRACGDGHTNTIRLEKGAHASAAAGTQPGCPTPAPEPGNTTHGLSAGEIAAIGFAAGTAARGAESAACLSEAGGAAPTAAVEVGDRGTAMGAS